MAARVACLDRLRAERREWRSVLLLNEPPRVPWSHGLYGQSTRTPPLALRRRRVLRSGPPHRLSPPSLWIAQALYHLSSFGLILSV